MSEAMMLIKTWTNGWSTSYHEEIRLPCLFGCDAKDELLHYSGCVNLWSQINHAMGILPGYSSTSAQARLCLQNPSRRSIIRLCIAFKSYHAVKIDHYAEILEAINSRSFDPLHEMSREIIRLLVDEYAPSWHR